jgi:hypothetical protein
MREFKIGDEITFNEANNLKNQYFDKYSKETYKAIEKPDDWYKRYEKLKKEFKENCKFKIIGLPND